MNFYTFTEIHLSLEDFHNAGLTPEETKEIIEATIDPFSPRGARFFAESSGINHNWKIKTSAKAPSSIRTIVFMFDSIFCEALVKKGKKIPYFYTSSDGKSYYDYRELF